MRILFHYLETFPSKMSLQQSLFFPQPEQLQQDADFLSLRINRIIALNKYKATNILIHIYPFFLYKQFPDIIDQKRDNPSNSGIINNRE